MSNAPIDHNVELTKIASEISKNWGMCKTDPANLNNLYAIVGNLATAVTKLISIVNNQPPAHNNEH